MSRSKYRVEVILNDTVVRDLTTALKNEARREQHDEERAARLYLMAGQFRGDMERAVARRALPYPFAQLLADD